MYQLSRECGSDQKYPPFSKKKKKKKRLGSLVGQLYMPTCTDRCYVPITQKSPLRKIKLQHQRLLNTAVLNLIELTLQGCWVFFHYTTLHESLSYLFFRRQQIDERKGKKRKKKNPCIDNEIRENFHCSRVATIERKTVMVQEINLD